MRAVWNFAACVMFSANGGVLRMGGVGVGDGEAEPLGCRCPGSGPTLKKYRVVRLKDTRGIGGLYRARSDGNEGNVLKMDTSV